MPLVGGSARAQPRAGRRRSGSPSRSTCNVALFVVANFVVIDAARRRPAAATHADDDRGRSAASGSGRSATRARGAVTANEIHIPVRTRVNVVATTGDVIHSFWVPELNRKIDMIPGPPQPGAARTPTSPGATAASARSSAALQHAHMAMYVYAAAAGGFRAWLRGAGRGRAPPATPRRPARARGLPARPVRELPRDPRHAGARARRARPHARRPRADARRADASRTRRAQLARLARATRSTSSPGNRMPDLGLADAATFARSSPTWRACSDGGRGTRGRRAAERLERIWAERPGVLGWLTTTDHKRIGLLYLFASLAFFAAGRRRGAADPHAADPPRQRTCVGPDAYDQLFTMHGVTMIFLFVIPMSTGAFGNYLLPLMIGARDMAFPRMNALSFWIFLASGIFIYSCAGDRPRARRRLVQLRAAAPTRSSAPARTSTSTASG